MEQLVLEAIEKEELVDLLEGKGKYRVELNRFVGANVPTDWARIIRSGIYKVYIDYPKADIKKQLENTLLEMIKGDVFDLYCALMVVFFQTICEQNSQATFKINRDLVLGNLQSSLIRKEEDMKNYNEWDGKNNKNGIWSEVLRVDAICKEDWNINILPNSTI